MGPAITGELDPPREGLQNPASIDVPMGHRGEMAEKERQSPFGPYRPKREESPFGPRPQRRPPRDPFAPRGEEPAPPPPRSRPRPLERPLDLLVEVAPGGAAAGHLPRLPGLCFRAGDADQLVRVAPTKVAEYLQWLADENLSDLTPFAAHLTRIVKTGAGAEIPVAERERVPGAPLWISGNPAALFRTDRYALNDEEVAAHFRFVKQVVRRMRLMVAGLTPGQRAWKPAPDRRSLDETLVHAADCVWWTCSRLDDDLPEPETLADEEPIDRLARLSEFAPDFLLSVPLSHRTEIHVPTRFLTSDPTEAWTHAKACRRQAEHVWEHLQGLPRAVQMAAEA